MLRQTYTQNKVYFGVDAFAGALHITLLYLLFRVIHLCIIVHFPLANSIFGSLLLILLNYIVVFFIRIGFINEYHL